MIPQAATGLDVFCLIGLYESLLNVLPHAKDFCGIEVAQLDWKFNTAGDDVDCSGSLSLVTIQNEPRTVRYSTEGNTQRHGSLPGAQM